MEREGVITEYLARASPMVMGEILKKLPEAARMSRYPVTEDLKAI
jgi:hypothetical protein